MRIGGKFLSFFYIITYFFNFVKYFSSGLDKKTAYAAQKSLFFIL